MHKLKGISLLELVLGLAILSVILISGMRYFHVGRESARVNQSLDMIKAVYGAAGIWRSKGLKFSDKSGSENGSDSDPLLVKFSQLDLLPSDYALDAKRNPWGGELKVEAEDDRKLKIILMKSPKTACEALKAKLSLKESGISLREISCTGNAASSDLTIATDV